MGASGSPPLIARTTSAFLGRGRPPPQPPRAASAKTNPMAARYMVHMMVGTTIRWKLFGAFYFRPIRILTHRVPNSAKKPPHEPRQSWVRSGGDHQVHAHRSEREGHR